MQREKGGGGRVSVHKRARRRALGNNESGECTRAWPVKMKTDPLRNERVLRARNYPGPTNRARRGRYLERGGGEKKWRELIRFGFDR